MSSHKEAQIGESAPQNCANVIILSSVPCPALSCFSVHAGTNQTARSFTLQPDRVPGGCVQNDPKR